MSAQEQQTTSGFRTSPQQQLLLEQSDHAVTQCAAFVRSAGTADLEAALRAALQRHEILRTTFPRPPGLRGRSQVVHDSPAFEWTVRDEPARAESEWLRGLLATEADRPFDLDNGPLARALLVSDGGDRGLLVLSAHAACADPGSIVIMLREVTEGGSGEADDPVQYADYAQWRYELLTGDDETAAQGRAVWQTELQEVPDLARILFERRTPAPAVDARVRALPIDLDAEQLARAAERSGATPALFLEAAWHALLARISGASELMVAGWSEGRGQPDLADAVGPYAHPLPTRSRIDATTTFAEVLDQVRRARAQASEWQDYMSADASSEVVEHATAAFAHVEVGPLPEGVEIVGFTPPAGPRPLLFVYTTGEVPVLTLCVEELERRTEDGLALAHGLRVLLAGAGEHPERPVSELELLDDRDRDEVLPQLAGPVPAADAATPVHELFERQAELSPDAPAVADAAGELSYRELSSAANRLAALLSELGVEPGDTVGLCMERTTKLLTAVLAAMKAGAAYLPLNHEHPPARLSHQLNESGASAVLTEEHLLERLPEAAVPVVCVDRDAERIASFPDDPPQHNRSASDLAYVMYTSGSTGLPKGVAVTHGNLANYATSIVELLGAGGRGLRFGVVSAISTDLGNTCIFPALICGGCVQLISPSASMDADAISAELGSRRLDVLKVTPSHLRALISAGSAAVLPRHWLLIGGEALSWDLIEEIESLSGCRILNHYGPTETTVGCCAYEVHGRRPDSATVPIGRPLAGVRAYVLGPGDRLLPAGVPGELCIAGAGVAAGYLGRDDAHAGPFSEDPISGERMYRTGDRARRLRDGAIEFLGRVDEQVKIRGFRIEPGEIESTLLRHPAIRQAAVVAEQDDRGEVRLVGYVATSAAPSVEELQDFLARSLPEYMVPSAFAILQSLPFTASGKVDRRALGELAAAQTRRQADYAAPRDEVEREIAGIWSELLGVERVGVFDDFFALGGHSLLATQAIMRIRRAHGDIPLGALLAAPTVADLAEVVRTASATKTT